MQIDWVTVAAQIVNFLVLVWLLQRVLYRPLARALKAREEQVRSSLREAEAARETAEAEAEAHRRARRDLEDERQARLAAAEQEADALRAEMTEKARDSVAERRAVWQAQLEDEKAAFLDRLRRRAGEAFMTLARRTLAEMADEELVDRIAKVFARRLGALDLDERTHLRSTAAREQAVSISSSFPLSPSSRTVVSEAVARVLEREAKIDFREEPELECGVVLAIGSRHVGWTLGEHLDALEADMARLLDARAELGANA
ncbi:F0F1 ATP synthase subunit delta [Elioraea sp.]|uniref:F0F1 ATP synthase subunit delta n=1 Tax=Elioraea sp. TaxID=2185103 RepID=UPI0025C59161|nr:F0F1 ATP synthase subunit delta [Elioraea sp.]